jgi:hypothetical protein
LVREAQEAVDSAAQVPTGSIPDDELPDVLVEIAALEAKAAALRLAVLAEADARELARSLAETGTDAWAARLTSTTRGIMAGGIWLANLLRDKYDATREAFADGGINEAQARVIVKAAELLPAKVTDEQRRAAEAGLVAKAVDGTGPRGLRQAARRMLDVVSRELADQHEAEQLEREEKRAEAETYMQLWDNADGTVSGRFTIPELDGQLLRTALERLTSPRRLVKNRAGEVVVDQSVPTTYGPLSWSERMGMGFTELIEHLPTDGFGPFSATMLVKVDYEHLLDGLGSAGLDTGIQTSASQARRLSCDAGIIPAVLGGRSEVLDWGRKMRVHTNIQRAALALTYDSCATVGCDRPFAWCEIHHPQLWSEGGNTDLDNGIPLCGFHHRRAHDGEFELEFLPDGEVRFRLLRSPTAWPPAPRPASLC